MCKLIAMLLLKNPAEDVSGHAGGMAMGPGSNKAYAGHVTTYVIISCIVAASGGALFGYDNGVTGGIVAMHPFLRKFFPGVDMVITGRSTCICNSLRLLRWSLEHGPELTGRSQHTF